ncbi:MAG: hypothetical protein WAV40_02575 [Microgenomates group bacterium]
MNKKTITIGIVIVLVIVLGIFLLTKKSSKNTRVVEDTKLDLPINVLPLAERPFITLSPDSTGRSLDISVSGAPTSGSMEYEMIYAASGKQEGVLGSIYLGSEKQPIVKSILLGSKSGGGKVTYHEGVTGGSITVTYGETRLKESWNFLHFDPADPTFSTTDARLSVGLQKTALKKDGVIITMKNFGYPKAGLPDGVKVVSGPYSYFTQTAIKGVASVSLKLPAGEHVNPTMYEWTGTAWKKLSAKLATDTMTATSMSSVFLVTAE